MLKTVNSLGPGYLKNYCLLSGDALFCVNQVKALWCPVLEDFFGLLPNGNQCQADFFVCSSWMFAESAGGLNVKFLALLFLLVI